MKYFKNKLNFIIFLIIIFILFAFGFLKISFSFYNHSNIEKFENVAYDITNNVDNNITNTCNCVATDIENKELLQKQEKYQKQFLDLNQKNSDLSNELYIINQNMKSVNQTLDDVKTKLIKEQNIITIKKKELSDKEIALKKCNEIKEEMQKEIDQQKSEINNLQGINKPPSKIENIFDKIKKIF